MSSTIACGCVGRHVSEVDAKRCGYIFKIKHFYAETPCAQHVCPTSRTPWSESFTRYLFDCGCNAIVMTYSPGGEYATSSDSIHSREPCDYHKTPHPRIMMVDKSPFK